jgi:hypothetical protein
MSALESQPVGDSFQARKHLCRLCAEPVERIADTRPFYAGRETAFGYRGCLCGQYVLEHTAQLAIDGRFTMGHPLRPELSAWVRASGAEMPMGHWPIVTLLVVEAAARERALRGTATPTAQTREAEGPSTPQ